MITNAELLDAIERCQKMYDHMETLASSGARSNWGYSILETIRNTPGLSAFIFYDDHRRAWLDRFTFNETLIEHFKITGFIPPAQKEVFQDGVDYKNIPSYSGLYFLGDSRWNPKTQRPEYWVKIGKGINLSNRLSQYFTCCSQLWPIAYSRDYDKENYYHKRLKKICLALNNHNKEWFMVDEQTYFEMCEKGFSYFD